MLAGLQLNGVPGACFEKACPQVAAGVRIAVFGEPLERTRPGRALVVGVEADHVVVVSLRLLEREVVAFEFRFGGSGARPAAEHHQTAAFGPDGAGVSAGVVLVVEQYLRGAPGLAVVGRDPVDQVDVAAVLVGRAGLFAGFAESDQLVRGPDQSRNAEIVDAFGGVDGSLVFPQHLCRSGRKVGPFVQIVGRRAELEGVAAGGGRQGQHGKQEVQYSGFHRGVFFSCNLPFDGYSDFRSCRR